MFGFVFSPFLLTFITLYRIFNLPLRLFFDLRTWAIGRVPLGRQPYIGV